MGAIQKLQIDHAQILYILDLGEEIIFFYENFINIAKVSWEISKPSWRYQNFLSREEELHVHSSLFMDEKFMLTAKNCAYICLI